jgi:methyl coenzyme M reductase subunit C-like uncharacterized protein (methanogenesis marker protein 7)
MLSKPGFVTRPHTSVGMTANVSGIKMGRRRCTARTSTESRWLLNEGQVSVFGFSNLRSCGESWK